MTSIQCRTLIHPQNGVTFNREVFASIADNVIVAYVNASTSGGLTFTHSLNTPQTVTSNVATTTGITMTARNSAEGGLASVMTYQVATKLVLNGGSAAVSGSSIRVTGANSATIIVSIATSFNSYKDGSGGNPASRNSAILGALPSSDINVLRQNHLNTYQAIFNRFSIDLGNNASLTALPTDQRISQGMATVDPGLISLFVNYGRAMLIGSSGPTSVQPANLQGIWQVEKTATWQR